jgi:TrmH family RNA methyltransferase
MISKGKMSSIKMLHQKKYRDIEQKFIVEGTKSCLEVLKSSLEVLETYVTQKWIFDNAKSTPFSDLFTIITPKEMESISCLSTPPEILSIVKIPTYSISEFKKDKPIIALDNVRDPGNLGTIIRTADWFGLDQIYCSENCVEFTNPKVIQATMGSFSRIKIVYGNLVKFLTENPERKKMGMFMEGAPIETIDFEGNEILIIGSESHGISEEISQLINQKIHIPNYHAAINGAESLNASIAAGILLYQFSSKKRYKLS